MFERFTESAREVVVLAQEEARDLRHEYIGSEHLLLGLTRQGGAATEVLESFGVTSDGARQLIGTIVGEGTDVSAGQIPFTPRAKKVLELALREALSLGDNYIGTAHLLLGLLRQGDVVATRVLVDLGAPLDEIRTKALDRRGGEPLPPAPDPWAHMLTDPVALEAFLRAAARIPDEALEDLPDDVRKGVLALRNSLGA